MAIIVKNPKGNGLVKSNYSNLKNENNKLKKRIEELEQQLTLTDVVASLLCVKSKHSEGLTLNKK